MVFNFDSRIIRRSYKNKNNKNNATNAAIIEERREGRFLSLMQVRPLRAPRTYIHLAAHLALDHFNRRSGQILPYLPDQLKDCDFYFSWEFLDTSSSMLKGATDVLRENDKECQEGLVESCPPFAMIGGMRTRAINVIAILTDVFKIPIISALTTDTDLDAKPFFSRTVPTEEEKGYAYAVYLESLGVSHAAILYSHNPWGIQYHNNVARALRERNIVTLSLPMTLGEPETVFEQLVKSEYKYVILLYSENDREDLFRKAYSYGVMGHPGYTWISGGGLASFVNPSYWINATIDGDLAKALHGTSYLEDYLPTPPALKDALNEFYMNRTMQKDFVGHFQEPEIFDGHVFPAPYTGMYTGLAYDAVMAMGLAACDTSGLFTGQEHFETLLRTEFEGASGTVAFDPQTHTRSSSSLTYAVRNIVISAEKTTSEQIFLEGHLASVINTKSNTVSQIEPYIYADNTTQPPLPLPVLVQDNNLIPLAAQIAMLGLAGLVLLLSLGWMMWIFMYRRAALVRASQPIFLCQLCIGTFIMGLSVIPLSLQEPSPKYVLDAACMSIPWLVFIGFVTSFSAIFAKTWRVNKLMNSATAFRRTYVRPGDVLWPFLTLITINVVLLLVWTVTNPTQWERVDLQNYDSFGRTKEFYGRCDNSGKEFMITLIIANFIPALISLKQCWKARRLSDDLSDSYYFAISVCSICETTILSIPVLVAVESNPTARYVLTTLYICALCLAILLPIFVPKYFRTKSWISGTSIQSFRSSNNALPRSMSSANLPLPLASIRSNKSNPSASLIFDG